MNDTVYTVGEGEVFAGSASPMRDPDTGKADGSVVVFGDITASKRAEEELALASEFRERMLGIVGHDLRNPLASISTCAHMLVRGAASDREARNAKRILASADRMARLISDLLDFTRGRLGGGIPIRREEADLGRVVRGALEELQTTHPGREIHLEADGPARCVVDPERMAQVVSNLVGNAIEHGSQQRPVTVRLAGEGDGVSLSVHNEGPAIPEDLVPRLFDAFRRGSAAGAKAHRADAGRSGVGLGLYIADQIVRAHGGRIEVRSTPEQGTTFTVRLPDCSVA